MVYTPPPVKPKPAQRKVGVGRTFKTGSASETDDVDETGEPETNAAVRQQVTSIAGRGDQDRPSDGKPRSTTGLFSDGTLKAMLQVQEDSQGSDSFGSSS